MNALIRVGHGSRRRIAGYRLLGAAVLSGAVLASGVASAAGRDLSGLSRDEITILQRRLSDAGCYRGAADGRLSPSLKEAADSCPSQDPVLRIELGMHTAPVRRVGVDNACRFAATGADDKTVRLWSLPEGKLIRTLRLPIGEGHTGKIFSVDMSPDGRLVAAGGWDSKYDVDRKHGVYLFDTETSQTVRRIGTLGNVVNHLAFSADGRKIAAALGAGAGIAVLDVDSGRLIFADNDYATDAYSVSWGSDGSLYATGWDGFIRRYNRDGRRTHKVSSPLGRQPYGSAVSPDGRRLAVGFADNPGVELFDPVTMKRVGTGDVGGITNGNVGTVAWTSDGSRLFAVGKAQALFDNRWRYFARVMEPSGRRSGRDRPISADTVMDLQPCRDQFVFTAADPSWGMLNESGDANTLGRQLSPDMREKKRDNFTVSPDGTRLRFGIGTGGALPVLVDLLAGTLTDAPGPVAGLVPPKTEGIGLARWENEDQPQIRGTTIGLKKFERSRAVAVRPDLSGFVMGADYTYRGYSSDGRELWQKAGPGVTWGVQLAKEGELVLTTHGDGTIRWHRWSDGQELLALFVHRDKRFVAWTPTGYYMASPGAEDLIGWHVNRGWEQPADFFPASRFRERFNRPDIVQAVLETLDESAAVERANSVSKKREEVKPITAKLPPVIRITSPGSDGSFSEGEVTINYELRSPSGLQVDKVDVLINGRPLTSRGFDRRPSNSGGGQTGSISVTLPQADAEVALVARSGDLASEPARMKLRYAGAAPSRDASALLKPKLYAFVVGVSDYVDPTLKLGYAAKDARDFADALKQQQGGMYGSVETRVVTNREVTRSALVEGLEWLEKEVTSRDVGVLFLAGHGVTDERQGYWFLPSDSSPDRVRVTALSQDEVRRSLGGLAGKALLFLDTCHAGRAVADGGARRRGAADINAVVNEFASAENGIVAFASSTGREVSLERDDWGNGAFTKALIEALAHGKADLLGRGTITLSQLDAFLANRVKELTGGTQHPNMTRPPTVPDYPIALVKK